MDQEEHSSFTYVIRPFRLIGTICVIVAIVLCSICMYTDYWAYTGDYHMGVWTACGTFKEGVWTPERTREYPDKIKCSSTAPRPLWLLACIILVCAPLFVMAIVIIILVFSFINGGLLGDRLAKFGGLLCLLCVISLSVCFIIFVICFTAINHEIDLNVGTTVKLDDDMWYFGWSYGCGWGSVIFLIGAFVLFFFCKREDEIYEAEKAYRM